MTSGSSKELATDGIVIEAYSYAPEVPPLGSCEEWRPREFDSDGNAVAAEAVSTSTTPAVDWQSILEEENRASFQAGLDRGIQQGRAMEREAQQQTVAERLERLAAGISELAGSFDVERSRYFERVENEVVRLALAIAARILRREAQADPLLLLGAVRVALGQLSASSVLRLRVPSADAELWRAAMALLPHQKIKVELAADESLRLGECVLETDLGSADLGVRAQLGEIERSFLHREPAAPTREFDLVHHQ